MGLFTIIPNNFISLDDTPTTYSGAHSKYVRVSEDQKIVYFNTVIGGITVSGTTPPDPNDASIWYNNGDLITYHWDPARNEWLSNDLHNYLFTYQGAASGLYMSIGEVGHEDARYLIPRPATITAILMSSTGGESAKTFNIVDDTTTVASFTSLNYEYQVMAEDIDLNNQTKLKIFITSAGLSVRNSVVILEIRWRYTP
jgi:hypothetical protein